MTFLPHRVIHRRNVRASVCGESDSNETGEAITPSTDGQQVCAPRSCGVSVSAADSDADRRLRVLRAYLPNRSRSSSGNVVSTPPPKGCAHQARTLLQSARLDSGAAPVRPGEAVAPSA